MVKKSKKKEVAGDYFGRRMEEYCPDVKKGEAEVSAVTHSFGAVQVG